MSLEGSLAVASSGLWGINSQLGVVSQNVANAGTANYAEESAAESSLTAGGVGMGVRTGVAVAATDAALQSVLTAQDGTVAALQVTSGALASVDAAQGTVGDGNDLSSQVGALSDAFTALDADPASQAEQATVVSAAATLASGIQAQAAAYQAARQDAQDGLVSDVTQLNTALSTIGTLDGQIAGATARGESVADLQSQRTGQEQIAAQVGGVRFIPAANGGVAAVLGGLVLDTSAGSGLFAIAAATVADGSAGPALTLGGTDVTAQIGAGSGSIGARLALRDSVLPQAEAGLDGFASTLASRFSAQGLTLFTDASGAVPGSATGFGSSIAVNPAIAATPSLVRDGTDPVAGSSTGASAFTPNPSGGLAGFTTLIGRVLDYTFGEQVQQGVPQPAVATTGLGASRTLSLGYAPGSTLQSFAANLVTAQATAAGNAAGALSTAQTLQATLQTKLSSTTGVSVDNELSHMLELQNAYGANAKVISAIQTMFGALLDAVQP